MPLTESSAWGPLRPGLLLDISLRDPHSASQPLPISLNPLRLARGLRRRAPFGPVAPTTSRAFPRAAALRSWQVDRPALHDEGNMPDKGDIGKHVARDGRKVRVLARLHGAEV